MIDPRTGQYVYPPGQAAPAVTPAVTRTKVYDAQNRVFIQETGQYTGEYFDPASNQVLPIPAQATTPAPVEPPKPTGPPENQITRFIKPATKAQREKLIVDIGARVETMLGNDMTRMLRPFLWGVVDETEALKLVQNRDQDVEKITNLQRMIAEKNDAMVGFILNTMQVNRDDIDRLVKKLKLSRVLRSIKVPALRDAVAMSEALEELFDAAQSAKADDEKFRAHVQQIRELWAIRDALRDPNVDPADPGMPLGGVGANTPLTVIHSPYHTGEPVSLSATLLLVSIPRSPSARLTLSETSAFKLKLPLLGASAPALPDAKALPAPPTDGVTLCVPVGAGANVTFWVPNEHGQPVPYSLAPGTEQSFPGRASVQVSFLDGISATPTGWSQPLTGVYMFENSAGAWKLTEKLYSISLDNLANGQPFHYRIDGQAGTVPPRQVVKLDRKTATTVVEFSRGNAEVVSRLLQPGADRCAVLLDAESRGLDLFPVEAPVTGRELADSRDATPLPAPAPALVDLDLVRVRYPVGHIED